MSHPPTPPPGGALTRGVEPYVKVRGELWALVTRALALDLIALGEEREVEGRAMFGLQAGGAFFPIAPASALGDMR